MITTSITAFCEMLKSLFDWKKIQNVFKASNQIIKDKKDLKKATNYAEKIFHVTDKYTKYFNKTDLKHYESWKKLFEKYN